MILKKWRHTKGETPSVPQLFPTLKTYEKSLVTEGRDITVAFITNWKNINRCDHCGKENIILSGIPLTITIRVPMTEEQHRLVAASPFWTAGDFAIQCNNGYSHTVDGYKGNWTISANKEEGARIQGGEIFEPHYPLKRGEHFEKVLAEFVPEFIAYLQSGVVIPYGIN